MTFATVTTPAFLATGFYNVDSSRFRAAPLDTRTEGWTEEWGTKEKKEDSPLWNLDDESISMLLATGYPQVPVVLSQFRPAFLEQIILRISGIAHIVINSQYFCNEATGQLPFLRDYQPSKPPALVGRRHPSNIAPPRVPIQNSILDYLMNNRKVDLDNHLNTEHQRSLSKCFLNLVHTELDSILTYLRYEDHDSWEQVYKEHYLQACSVHSNSWISSLKGRIQACMERAVSRRCITEFSKTMSIEQALERAKEAYQALESQLTKHSRPYLLGTESPSLVDAVLWAHLADALCDVNLVVLLSSYPALVKYFQRMYKTYFTGKLGKWDEWNIKQNMENAFQQIPILSKKQLSSIKASYKDAIDLMQSLSMRNQDLHDVLEAAKAKRKEESWPTSSKPTDSILYRWRMGEDLNKFTETPEPPENQSRKKLIREQERIDQIWISGVAGISLLLILVLQGTPNSQT